MAAIRVLIVDDHAVVQWGFKVLLGRQRWVDRCIVASDPEEGLAAAARHKPHVALVDLFLGERSGAELCEAIRGVSPATRVLLISGVGWISPQAAKTAGASGFVSKDWSADEVAMAVRMVGKGMTVFGRQEEAPATPLSEREREVLTLIASGATNKEIAERLGLSHRTVQNHVQNTLNKLQLHNRVELARYAIERGL